MLQSILKRLFSRRGGHGATEAWEPHFRSGLLALDGGDYAAGAKALERAVELGAQDALVHNALGAAHLMQDDIESAVDEFRRALALDPRSVQAHSNLGYVLVRDLECYEEGARHIAVARELAPTDPNILCNWMLALLHTGRQAEAHALAEALLAQKPAFAEVRVHRALMLLAEHDFGRGWPDYEARKRVPRSKCSNDLALPEWDGSPLHGRRVFVYAEQGLGDEIMFASCVPDLAARGARCTLECHPKLEKIFRRSFPGVDVVAKGVPYPPAESARELADVKVAAGSLPLFFRRDAADFRRQADGYLRAGDDRVAHWKARLAALPGARKVGISWRGGLRSTRLSLRSIPLRLWLPVLSLPGIDFVSLQYADPEGELEAVRREGGLQLHHWPEAIDDYDETAALACALDLVVSVQTAAVHLCGALGRPVWALIPAVPEWRYGARGQTMPWYASVRLMRQSRTGEWEPEILALRGELERWESAFPRS